jgi:hypothetical protein
MMHGQQEIKQIRISVVQCHYGVNEINDPFHLDKRRQVNFFLG